MPAQPPAFNGLMSLVAEFFDRATALRLCCPASPRMARAS